MTRAQIARFAMQKLEEFGYYDWYFGFNNWKTVLGKCEFDIQCVSFSVHYLGCSDQEIIDTILHEIAHIRAGPEARHDSPEFIRACLEVGADPDNWGKAEVLAPARWTATCKECGAEYHQYRKANCDYQCTDCGSNVVFVKH